MHTPAQQIYNLIAPFVSKGTMLARSVTDIENAIDDFITLSQDGIIIACCGVRKHQGNNNHTINELYCLAVDKKCQGQGLSKQLFDKVLMQTTGDLLALSKYQGEWFLQYGFHEILPNALPHTINYDYNRDSKIFIKHRNNS
jgi:N-acetylglutamate synthase-like GNAT family acetyltransferase